MAKIFWGSMMGRLVMALVSVAVVPVLIVGYFSFQAASKALEKAESDKLYSERELRGNELRKYFRDTMQNMQFMADTPSVRTAAVTLTSYHQVGRSSEDAPFDVLSPLYSKIHDKIHSFFSSFMSTHESAVSGYDDILILDASDGHVMYSERMLGDLGGNVKKGALKDTGLAKVWQRVIETKKPATVDYSIYPVTDFPALFMGLPIAGEEGKLGGVLVLRLGSEYIHAVLKATEAQGRTVEAYLVGQDYKMRSDSRFAKEFTILNKEVKTKATTEALQEKTGTDLIQNYRGVTVLCSYGTLGLHDMEGLGADFDWVIIAETDATEAFQPVSTLGNSVILIALCLTLAALAVAIFLAPRHVQAGDSIGSQGRASKQWRSHGPCTFPGQERRDWHFVSGFPGDVGQLQGADAADHGRDSRTIGFCHKDRGHGCPARAQHYQNVGSDLGDHSHGGTGQDIGQCGKRESKECCRGFSPGSIHFRQRQACHRGDGHEDSAHQGEYVVNRRDRGQAQRA